MLSQSFTAVQVLFVSMVCSAGSVKMAVMARLLASGSLPEAATVERAGRQKLVAQYIQKELLEADEANLLDEEDMHIFDLNPLTDPLHLVCCNTCKKPVKASQFVMHAELCRSLAIAEELLPELDNGMDNRKPPRKERKKLVTAGNQVTSIGAQERFAIVNAFETTFSTSQLEKRVGISSSFLVEAKDLQLVEAKETPGKIACSAGELLPLTKRRKLISADTAQPSDEIQMARGVSNTINYQDAFTYVPAPLATKTYYSQRNYHLQAAISYMYHQELTKEICVGKREFQRNLITSDASSVGAISQELSDAQPKKDHDQSSPNVQRTDQILKPGSKVSLVKAECQPSNNSVNQFSMIDAHTSLTAATGAGTRYHSKPYSFAGNSGTPLATIQQPTGSVHVV